jgi:hypothetical protein
MAKWAVSNSGWERASMWQKGHTKLYTQTHFHADKFAGGYPNIAAVVEGKKVFTSKSDIEDGRSTLRNFSRNPSWCILDYLTTDTEMTGMGIPVSEIDLDSFVTAADVCDEIVYFGTYNEYNAYAKDEYLDDQGVSYSLKDSDTVDNEILIEAPSGVRYCPIKTGDQIVFPLTSPSQVPQPYSTSLTVGLLYYARVTRWESRHERYMESQSTLVSVNPTQGTMETVTKYKPRRLVDNQKKFWRVSIHTTREDAWSGNAPVTLTANPSGLGTGFIQHDNHCRYQLDGIVESSVKPMDILQSMLTSMAGELYHTNGKWRIKAGAWTAPVETFTEDDIVGPISISTKSSASERINAVKGKYIGLDTGGKPTDYPPVVNSTYLSEDDNVRNFGELDLIFTDDPIRAQRIAKIKLEAERQEIRVETEFNLKGMQIQAGDNINLTIDRYGWSAKPFAVIEWELITNADKVSVRVLLKETAEGVFDWNAGEETTYDLSSNTDLDDPFELTPPRNLSASVVQDTDNYVDQVLGKVTLTWDSPTDEEDDFVDSYRVSYKEWDASEWINYQTVPADSVNVDGNPQSVISALPLGYYDFSVTSVTQEGIQSHDDAFIDQFHVDVLSPTPPDVENLSAVRISGFAKMKWDKTTEPTVLAGGKCVIRHDEATSGASWNTSVLMAELSGDSEEYDAPLKTGTYFIKFKNNQGGVSTNAASFILTQDNTIAYNVIATITEDATYLGDKLRTEVVGGNLQLGRE